MAEDVIVTDAGPILHLHWVGASDWALPDQAVCVVETVWREIERHAPSALTDTRLRRLPDPTSTPVELTQPDLDPGERAALAHALLARPTGSVQILLDDTRARRACRDLGLQHTGTIGLILEAHASGAVSYVVARAALRALPISGGLWLHPHLLHEALSALRDRESERGSGGPSA
jgi:predicted nucleic acid-binding protein